MVRANSELQSTISEMRTHQELHEKELERLMNEISRLHEDCYRIETDKNAEIKKISENHEREMTTQIRNLKKSSEDGKELLELQIKKLK